MAVGKMQRLPFAGIYGNRILFSTRPLLARYSTTLMQEYGESLVEAIHELFPRWKGRRKQFVIDLVSEGRAKGAETGTVQGILYNFCNS